MMRARYAKNIFLVLILLCVGIKPSLQQAVVDAGAGQGAVTQPALPLDSGAAGTQPIGVISNQPQAENQLNLIPVTGGEPDLRPAVPATTTPVVPAAAAATTTPVVPAAATTTPAVGGEPDLRPAVPATTTPTPEAGGQNDLRPAVPATNVPLDAGAAGTLPINAGTNIGGLGESTLQPSVEPVTTAPIVADPVTETTPGEQVQVEVDAGQDSENMAPPAPPGPPKNWEFLPEDKTITFGLELVGPSLVPWTKTKSWNFVQTLHDYVFQSADVSSSIEVGVTDTYRKQVEDRNLPGSDESYKEDSGVQMRLSLNTNSIRVESEVKSMVQAIQSGQLAKDLGIALGTEITNITMITDPEVTPYNSVDDPNESSGGSLPGWIIGAIVGGIIILLPIPGYLLYRRSKKKHIEALEKQQAEAAAARQRMQSRIIRSTGGKSFSYQTGDEMMEGGMNGQEFYLNTPNASVTDRQMSGSWAQNGRTPSGLIVQVDKSGRSINNMPGYGGNSPTRSLRQQSQRALYQQNSLGPGGMPPVNRVSSFSSQQGARHTPGSVYPVRYSDSASLPSSSSGNNSR